MISDIIRARQRAESTKSWIVVVVPPDQVPSYLRVMATFVGGSFSGRTFLMPNGGKVTVVGALDAVIEYDVPYSVTFLGWGGKADGTLMQPWREAATEVLHLTA